MHWPGHVEIEWQREAIQIAGLCGVRSWWVDLGTEIYPSDRTPGRITVYVSDHADDVQRLADYMGTLNGLDRARLEIWRWHARWA